MVRASVAQDVNLAGKEGGSEWGKVSAVLFDMAGVLCNSEETSRLAAVDLFKEMGFDDVTVQDFVPFMGTGMYAFCFSDTLFIIGFCFIEPWLFMCLEGAAQK